ncbi:MAG: hypothetical protein HQL58_08960 [Magnetococcales bacterium]|nr:hypothetical protein [Magnetococcales bacterium]
MKQWIDLKMPPALLKAQIWFDGMEPRKRIMVVTIVLLLLAMVWQNLVWMPHQQRVIRLKSSVAEFRKNLPELSTRVERISTDQVVDLNAERLARIQTLEQQQHELAATLGREAGALIQPVEMVKALRRLLAERPKVKLYRLEAASVQPVQLNPAVVAGSTTEKGGEKGAGKGTAVPVIYRHDIELEIEAGYLDMLDFFREIESYHWVFFWEEVRYHAVDYPKTRATVRLFTLSMGEGLIGG